MSISQLPPKKHLLFLVPIRRGTIILFSPFAFRFPFSVFPFPFSVFPFPFSAFPFPFSVFSFQ